MATASFFFRHKVCNVTHMEKIVLPGADYMHDEKKTTNWVIL